MTRESDSRNDPEIAKRLEMFSQQATWRPESPRTPLPIVAERSLAGIDTLREELIATGIDPLRKHSDPFEGALFNQALVSRLTPIVGELFTRAHETVWWMSGLRALIGTGDPVIQYNLRNDLKLTGRLRDESLAELDPDLIQRVWDANRGDREIAVFGNETPDIIIRRFAARLRKHQRK